MFFTAASRLAEWFCTGEGSFANLVMLTTAGTASGAGRACREEVREVAEKLTCS